MYVSFWRAIALVVWSDARISRRISSIARERRIWGESELRKDLIRSSRVRWNRLSNREGDEVEDEEVPAIATERCLERES